MFDIDDVLRLTVSFMRVRLRGRARVVFKRHLSYQASSLPIDSYTLFYWTGCFFAESAGGCDMDTFFNEDVTSPPEKHYVLLINRMCYSPLCRFQPVR